MSYESGTVPAPFDAATLEYYGRDAPLYRGSGTGGRNRFLDHFIRRLPEGSRILDLGCGGGIDTEVMIAHGLSVDAMEASPAIAAAASQRIGRNAAIMRFDELEAVAEYDAVWASASLIHVPRAALSATLLRVYRALKPGGRHFATYKSGGHEGRDSAGRYYNYPSAAELRRFYEVSAAWTGIEIQEYVGGGFENGSGPWLAIEARRPFSETKAACEVKQDSSRD